MSRRSRGTGALLAVLAMSTLAACTGSPDGVPEQGFVSGAGVIVLEPSEREPAPDLTGELLGGGTYSLADERGDDVMVINVWGSWCAPCRAEAAALEEVHRELADQGVQFLGINTRDNEAAASKFVKANEITYPSLVDDGSLLARFSDSLPAAGIPTTYVIDREGRVAVRTLSEVTYSGLLDLVEPILAEPAA